MKIYIKQKIYHVVLILLLTAINCFVINPAACSLQAQTTTQLSTEEWKALEGYYQNSRNKDMYVQFTAKGDHLRAKMLWNNNELKLFPSTALDFATKENVEDGPLQISFKKDGDGKVTQLLLNKDVVWTKANDYKPVEKKEMSHTPAQLKPYEGIYQLQRDNERFIQFTEKDNKLVLKQHWDSKEVAFLPETDTSFFSPEVPLFSLIFLKSNEGNITGARVNKRDTWDKLKKAAPTREQFKAIEGKYQFKDDPDNIIQLTAKGNNLVVKQLWDNTEYVLEAQSDSYFYNSQQSYPLQVVKDSEGKIVKVLVLGIDEFVKVK